MAGQKKDEKPEEDIISYRNSCTIRDKKIIDD